MGFTFILYASSAYRLALAKIYRMYIHYIDARASPKKNLGTPFNP